MNQATEQWYILGAGAIGHLFACRFAEQELPATLITHHIQPENTQQVDYCFDESHDKKQLSYSLSYQHHLNVKHINNLLLTVKSHQVKDAILGIKHALTVDSKIYLLQNGMGNLEKVTGLLQGIVPANQIFPGTNTHGVYLNNKDVLTVVHAGKGEIIFGANYLSDATTVTNVDTADSNNANLNQLTSLNLAIKWSNDIEKRLWLKLAVNAVINPMTALQQCLNGELLDSVDLKKDMDTLCKETASLFEVLKIDINLQQIIDAVYSVIYKTSNNQSSMLQDINAMKISENQSISGYILEIANKHNVEMPNHQLNYQQIETMSKSFNSK